MIKAQAIGRIGKDAVSREVNGKTVANFSVAAKASKDKTQWVECSIWDKPNLTQYLKKGTQIYCDGEVHTEHYINKDGEIKTLLKMSVYKIELLGGKSDVGEDKAVNAVQRSVTGDVLPSIDTTDDLPF